MVKQLPAAITAPEHTATLVSDACHLVHFDQPAVVRAIAVRAGNACARVRSTGGLFPN